jgi:hypothetical protein
MRAVLSLPLELERRVDRAFPGREAAVRNEGLRQISHQLRRLDTRTRHSLADARNVRHD